MLYILRLGMPWLNNFYQQLSNRCKAGMLFSALEALLFGVPYCCNDYRQESTCRIT